MSMHRSQEAIWSTTTHLQNQRKPGVRIRKLSLSSHEVDNVPVLRFESCKFIPLSVLKTYFADNDRIEELVRTVYDGNPEPGIHTKKIFDKYLRIFCVLLFIGKGHYIHRFLRGGAYTDDQLPLELLSDLPVKDDAERQQFKKAQWEFFPYTFEREDFDFQLDESRVLPMTVKTLRCNPDVTITKIVVDAEYDKLRLMEGNDHTNHVYVLKSSQTDNYASEQSHLAEVTALEQIAKRGTTYPKEIVEYFGSFKQGGIANIILEFANGGSLEDFFKSMSPPFEHHEHVDFWQAIYNLCVGLSRVHVITSTRDRAASFQGYHQDLKPANILVFYDASSPTDKIRFKIADFGKCHLGQVTQVRANFSGPGRPGVRTYGSPESSRARRLAGDDMVSYQASDVWSMGCIISVAATWVIGGQHLVDRFSERRASAPKDASILQSDCFHDGFKVLDTVEDWHRQLVRWSRKMTDDVTVRIWPKLLQSTFHSDMFVRTNAQQLHHNFHTLLNKKTSGWIPHVPLNLTQNTTIDWDTIINNEKSAYHQLTTATPQTGAAAPVSAGARSTDKARPVVSIQDGNEAARMSKGKTREGDSGHRTQQAGPSRQQHQEGCPYSVASKNLPFKSVKELRNYSGPKKYGHEPSLDELMKVPMKHRDLVFLIDDSPTLRSKHWNAVIELFEGLTNFLDDCDPDGMETYFTAATDKNPTKGNARKLITVLKSINPNAPTHPPDPGGIFSAVYYKYKPKLKSRPSRWPVRSRKDGRPLSIFFFTDAQWFEDPKLTKTIKEIVEYLEQDPKVPAGYVGIQFIRFGDDANAKAALNRLDNADEDLGLARDIVDHVDSKGNVWKMLYGPMNRSYDAEGEVQCTCTT